jgi:hypothetical protein
MFWRVFFFRAICALCPINLLDSLQVAAKTSMSRKELGSIMVHSCGSVFDPFLDACYQFPGPCAFFAPVPSFFHFSLVFSLSSFLFFTPFLWISFLSLARRSIAGVPAVTNNAAVDTVLYAEITLRTTFLWHLVSRSLYFLIFNAGSQMTDPYRIIDSATLARIFLFSLLGRGPSLSMILFSVAIVLSTLSVVFLICSVISRSLSIITPRYLIDFLVVISVFPTLTLIVFS